ncbi:CocE/NonD family hydrolase C-terminal non-catalytic domain-containing protein [Streptomyces sp. ID05-47C]|uniref:CocE/NonD family hydrolase C-terminal non-catalytic domain-containing protein n=1 Tax=Streptomyces sp. ID05-47C TaxID=3028665 RepID=UPI0029B19A35|nr:CocE/NonD family hydrolase C-terminal non-catalytic domain-containing protein [Streptomyces sp. ID05-47C]MDX3568538.1 CocE/NonD family hydrolase C-terminal non-catalytic domain-containing protein [Streptomyces sp. ID05-47C]
MDGVRPGPLDQAAVEAREDVLVFTSEPLAEDLEVTGRVRAVLFAATDGPSTDWVARLCDVDENGVSLNVRARGEPADPLLRRARVPKQPCRLGRRGQASCGGGDDPAMPIGDIAQAVGYRSEFAFSRVFSREQGIAPGRYRRTASVPS